MSVTDRAYARSAPDTLAADNVGQKLSMKPITFAVIAILLGFGSATISAADTRDSFAGSLPADSKDIHNRAKLIDLWSNASRKPPGKQDDEIQVRIIKLPDGLSVSTVRWLSADSAVAQCDLNEVRYLAFFFLESGKWTFVRHYSLGKAKK
jgi:hypothetical protein